MQKAKVAKPSAELKAIVDELNKKYGENVATLGMQGSYTKDSDTQRIPTGSLTLDLALGGGIPIGRYIEVSGGESSTKTTQCIHILKSAMSMGVKCVYLDVEGTIDNEYFAQLGVTPGTFIYSRPDSMEQALDIILDLQRQGEVKLGFVDSIAALAPNKEKVKSLSETMQMGVKPTLLGEFFRKFQMNNNKLDREGEMPFTVVGINQLREKPTIYGDPEYTPGGKAKDFTSSINIRLRRGDFIVQGKGKDKEFVGQVVKFKVEKNKTYKRMTSGEFDFYYAPNSAGVLPGYNDYEKEVVVCAVEYGVVERAGAWFKYGDNRYQGLPALVDALRTDKKLLDEIREKVVNISSQELAQ